MTDSRFGVTELDELPDDLRERIGVIAEKSGFVPNIFRALGHRRRIEQKLRQECRTVAYELRTWSGRIRRLPPPLSAWTSARDAPRPAAQTFREWWRTEHGDTR